MVQSGTIGTIFKKASNTNEIRGRAYDFLYLFITYTKRGIQSLIQNSMDKFIVIDNFFTEKEFDILCDDLNKISFERTGNYGYSHEFKPEKHNAWLFKKVKNNFFPDEDLKPFDMGFRYRHNCEEVLKHIDEYKYSFICYLKGKELLYNGTGFYNDNQELDRYIGFVANRALFFPSNKIYHTDLQALGESSPRYCVNIFYDY